MAMTPPGSIYRPDAHRSARGLTEKPAHHPRRLALVLGGWDFLTDVSDQRAACVGTGSRRSAKRAGDFSRLGDRHFAVRPGERADIEASFLRNGGRRRRPRRRKSATCGAFIRPHSRRAFREDLLDETLYGFVDLLQALNATRTRTGAFVHRVVTNQLADVSGAEAVCPEKSASCWSAVHGAVSGASRAVGAVIDVGPGEERWVANRLMGELKSAATRGRRRCAVLIDGSGHSSALLAPDLLPGDSGEMAST